MEKAAAKAGVVLQSVKEVLLGMVADDMVHEERIGASKYYWAFPSEHAIKACDRQFSMHCSIHQSLPVAHKTRCAVHAVVWHDLHPGRACDLAINTSDLSLVWVYIAGWAECLGELVLFAASPHCTFGRRADAKQHS